MLLGPQPWTAEPAWIMEGMADWAALTVDPVDYSVGGGNLTWYSTTQSKPLFSRSYDSVGFWGHVQDVYGNLWARIPAIMGAGSESAFALAGAGGQVFLNTWGSSAFNRYDAGGWPWQMISPIRPPASIAAPASALVPNRLPSYVYAAPYTTGQYVLDGNPGEPIVHVSIFGPARLGQLNNITDLQDAWFCTAASCKCPPGTQGSPPPTVPLDVPARLGISADGTGTHGTITAYSLDDICKKTPTNSGSGNGDAGTGGDPHLDTFGQDFYDFQAAGEFTLLQASNRNDLQVQVRQQPFPHSRSIAVNTAVAIRDGNAIVEIDSTSASSVSAFIDHHPFDGTSATLAGGGKLTVQRTSLFSLPPGETPTSKCESSGEKGPGLTFCELMLALLLDGQKTAEVTWRDGTSVQVSNGVTSPTGQNWTPALSLQIHVARDRFGHLEGLLGDTGVPSAREYLSRSGKPYTASELTAGGAGASSAAAKALYDGFGGSWRITQKASLFTYARGKSTRSYTILDFPKQRFSLSKAPPAAVRGAAADCQAVGAENTHVEQDCVYDVAATGNAGFAGGDLPLQKVASAQGQPGTPPATPALTPIELGASGAEPRIAYDPSSGDTYLAWIDNSGNSIDVCTVTPAEQSCNGGAGPYKLVDPVAQSNGDNPISFADGLVVAPSGQVVVLGEIEGASAADEPLGYTSASGVVAWSSPAGGAAFASAGQGIANGGLLLASTPGTGEAPSGGAIALDATDIGVYGDSQPFGNGFTDFGLSAPAPSTTPTVDSTADYGDQLETDGAQVASIPSAANPGQYTVVTVGGADSATPGCPSGTQSATGYATATGTPASLQMQATWSSSYFQPISCQAQAPVLAGGGASGATIGLLESEGPGLSGTGSEGVYFRAFDPAAQSFGGPVLVSDETDLSTGGADSLSLAADDEGGMYASWLDHRGWVLSYSSDDGQSWQPVASLNLPAGVGNAVLAGLGAGNAELAFATGGQEYLVAVPYPQLVAAQRRSSAGR